MAKIKIESQITLLAVIIAVAVITSGFFAWKSLSNIVSSIHEETRPDNRLFLLKDITNDLSAVENNARLYILTDNANNQQSYNSLQNNITRKIHELYEITPPRHQSRELVDSFQLLTISKVKLWNGILQLHENTETTETEFSEIYEQLEKQKLDTTITITEKKSIFRRIFGSTKQIADTTITERKIQTDEFREQIRELQKDISEKDEEVNLLESNLIAQNIFITKKINRLVTQAEQNEARSLINKTNEADRLATLTYKRLAGFSIAAVLLLLLVLFILFKYVSKRRAFENGLKKARTEAENLARAKEQFAANVSHEMRTPVNAIYGLAEQLLRRKNNDNLDEQISVLAQSSHHLNQIINDTLDFTKIQTGKIRFDAVHFSPEQVFHEIYSLQKYSAVQKGIALEFELNDNLPEALVGDPLRLKQILINLIGNAIKFTPEGKVAFQAKASKKQNGEIELRMQVADTGIGISKDEQKTIFEEFVQAGNHEGKKYRGTGLGLAIVKKLTELQDGKIDLDSEPDVGTTISLTIPYPAGDAGKIEKPAAGLQEVPDYIKQLRVLIADDEEFNRFVLKSVFNKWNIQFIEATNGNEAVRLALNETFDIVMMDLRMPGKNGIEATQEILKTKPDTKIIAITATENKHEKQQCIDAGMTAFLPKPFSEEQLFAVMHSSINKPDKGEKTSDHQNSVAAFEKMAGGEQDFLKEMVTLFIRSTENGLAEISGAIEKGTGQEIADAAHKIAPQCKQIGEMKLYAKLKELEKIAENKPADKQIMNDLFTQIDDTIKTINRKLKNYLQQMKN